MTTQSSGDPPGLHGLKNFHSAFPLATWVVTALLGLGQIACDEEQTEAKVEAKTSAAQAELAPPSPAPLQAVKPEKQEAPRAPSKKWTDCPQSKQVVFANDEMEAHFRLKAQKPDGKFTTSDLKKLRSLNFSRMSLNELDICIFHHTTNLRELMLGPGKVWDLGPLKGAKDLESLIVRGNPIDDLSPISELKKMDRLDISNTRVKDLKEISELVKITELTLDGAPLSDLAPISQMLDLERLSIKRTKVSNLEPLEKMKKLKFLYVAESPIADDISATGKVHQNGTKVVSE